ncbi:MAG: LysR family transcriptional regulator [Neptuniibacter sp.]
MRLRNLNTFVNIARLGSFHAAAQQLHATQPAISARINSLEDELGVQLFIRDQSGTRLSPRGTQLLPYAEKMLAISQEMKQQVSAESPQKGTLRIGISDTLSYLWLSNLLQHWQAQHPLISFELISDVTNTLIKQLEAYELDLALTVEISSPALVSEPLCSYPQHWVSSPDLPDARTITSVSDLQKYPILSFPRETRPWQYLQQLFRNFEDQPLFHTSSSVVNLLTLAENGVGVALLPEPVIKNKLAQGRLIKLNVGEDAPLLNFCYSWRLDDDRILPKLLADSGREIITV